jgi:hypothetical protein
MQGERVVVGHAGAVSTRAGLRPAPTPRGRGWRGESVRPYFFGPGEGGESCQVGGELLILMLG